MRSRYPLTTAQLHQFELDLAQMKVLAEEMFHLMTAGCGGTDQRAVRAQELAAAVQRLQWAIERGEEGDSASGDE